MTLAGSRLVTGTAGAVGGAGAAQAIPPASARAMKRGRKAGRWLMARGSPGRKGLPIRQRKRRPASFQPYNPYMNRLRWSILLILAFAPRLAAAADPRPNILVI